MYCLFCVVLCIVCVLMCTVLLPPSGYPIAVNKYIHMITYHINVTLSDRHSEQERWKPVILFMIGVRDFSLFQGPNFGNHINSLSLFLSLSLSYSTGIKGPCSRSAVCRNMKLDIHICLVPRLKTSAAKTPHSQSFMTWTKVTLPYVTIVLAPRRHHQCCLQRLQTAKQSSDMTAHNGTTRYGHRCAQLTVERRHFGIPRHKVTKPKKRSSKSVVFKHLPPAVTQQSKRSIIFCCFRRDSSLIGPWPPNSRGF